MELDVGKSSRGGQSVGLIYLLRQKARIKAILNLACCQVVAFCSKFSKLLFVFAPGQFLPMYVLFVSISTGIRTMELFVGKRRPHIFAVTEGAYQGMHDAAHWVNSNEADARSHVVC